MTSTGKKTSVTFNPNPLKYSVNKNGKCIETTVTNICTEAEQWIKLYCKTKEKATVIGLGTGCKALRSFIKRSKAVTLHLYIDDKCSILQLMNMDNFSGFLKNFFMNPMLIFAGIAVDWVNNELWNEYGFRACKTLYIFNAARMRWPAKFSNCINLEFLAREVVNVHIDYQPKHVSESKWETRMLCLEQVGYATMEAYASYCVGHKLLIGD